MHVKIMENATLNPECVPAHQAGKESNVTANVKMDSGVINVRIFVIVKTVENVIT